MTETALYRLFNADDLLLYVGISKNPKKRWGQHALEKPWWHEVAEKTVEWHPDHATAVALETQAIAAERPAYDQTARRYVSLATAPPRLEFDYSQEQASVVEAVTQKIQSGVYGPGKRLQAARVGREHGVSACIARDALDVIHGQLGLVRRDMHAYRVQGTSAPAPVPRFVRIPLGDADVAADALREALSVDELAALLHAMQSPS